MRTTYTLTILLWLTASAFISDPIKLSTKDILSTVQKERRVGLRNQTVEMVSRLNYSLPVLKSLGFRYGTDDLTNAKQQFALNFGFNGWKAMKEQKSLKNAQINLLVAERDAALGEVIFDRYNNMVDAYFAQIIIEKNSALEALYNQKSVVLKESLKKGIPIKVKDLVETEDAVRDLRVSMVELSNVQSVSTQRIRDYLGIKGFFVLNFDNFIGVQRLEEIVAAVKTQKQNNAPELKIEQGKVGLAQSELKAESAAFGQIFDGLQLIYENGNKSSEVFKKDISFRVGFNIPLKSGFRAKQNDLMLDVQRAESDYQYALYEHERAVRSQVLRIENLVKQYKLAQDSETNSLTQTILNTPSVLNTLSAAEIVDLKIIQQKKAVELANVYYDIVKEYVNLLALTGDLSAAPYKNYLTNVLERW